MLCTSALSYNVRHNFRVISCIYTEPWYIYTKSHLKMLIIILYIFIIPEKQKAKDLNRI